MSSFFSSPAASARALSPSANSLQLEIESSSIGLESHERLGERRNCSRAAIPALARGVAQQPTAVITASDLSSIMQSTVMKALAPFSGSAARQVVVDPTETFQRFDGVGAAITDTAAYGLTVNLTAAQRHALLTEMFGANGFQTVRISMGASDFQSVPYFTYDDSGSASLANFSVQPDASRVIPVLREILAINPRLKVIA